jgi:ABC-type phosphate/phosphonate transport system substrate-binding protein
MQAVLLVRMDSPYQRLTDLRGKRVAFGGGANAFFASIVPRVMLKRAGLHGQYQDASAQATGAVAQVLQQLHAGAVDAVAIGTPALQNKRLRAQYIDGRMRVLARSDALPGLAWLASPAVDADTREALRYLLLNFGTDAPGHAELAATGTDRLVAADNATYAPVAKYLRELAEP